MTSRPAGDGGEAAFRSIVAMIDGDSDLALAQFDGLTRLEVIGALGFLVAGYADLIGYVSRLGQREPAEVLKAVALRLATNERPNQ